MNLSRLSWAVASFIILTFLGTPVAADSPQSQVSITETCRFNFTVPKQSYMQDSTVFHLEIGEEVTIKGSISPFFADVKYGLIAPDGLFYSIPAEDGILDFTFIVAKRGIYYFTVFNNSSFSVSVDGFISY